MAESYTTKNITTVEEVNTLETTDKIFVNDSDSLKQISLSNLMDSSGALKKNQDTENAGKTLVVGEDGNVIPGEEPVKVDDTLTQPGQAADAKATGDRILNLAIHQTATGNPITLTDAGEGIPVVDFAMDGKTEQVQTTGAQLFDASRLQSTSAGGATVTNNGDGSFTISGSGNLTNVFSIRYDLTEEEKNMLMSGQLKLNIEQKTNPYFVFGVYNSSGESVTNVNSAPTSEESVIDLTEYIDGIKDGTYLVRAWFYGPSGRAIAPGTVKPMVYQSGDGTWEPYTGGQPSPSPDYPQEIINAGKYNEESQKWEYEVKLQGKNLAKVVNFSGATIAGVKVIVDKNGRYKLSGVATGGLVYLLNQPHGYDFGNFPIIFTLKAGHKYRIMDTQLFTRRNDGTTATIGIVEPSDLGGNGIIYEPIQDLSVIGIRIYIKNGATYNDSTLYTPGAWEDPNGTDTTWEPYRIPQSLTLTSDRPLTKWDKLEKRDGQWGWMFKSGKTELDGSEDENWSYYSEGRYWTNMQYKKLSEVGGEKSLICDKLRVLPTSSSAQDIENNTIKESGTLGVTSVFICAEETGNDVTSLRAWLQSNPLTIWYETAEETFVPLTESEQTALEALTTYFPTTIIAVESGEFSPEIKIEYVADTKTYIDNKFAELAQNLSATQNTLLEV